jgi:hypothetical protein
MKITVTYNITREAIIDVSEETVKNLDFQTMWEELYKIDSIGQNLEGEILAVTNSDTGEGYYCN